MSCHCFRILYEGTIWDRSVVITKDPVCLSLKCGPPPPVIACILYKGLNEHRYHFEVCLKCLILKLHFQKHGTRIFVILKAPIHYSRWRESSPARPEDAPTPLGASASWPRLRARCSGRLGCLSRALREQSVGRKGRIQGPGKGGYSFDSIFLDRRSLARSCEATRFFSTRRRDMKAPSASLATSHPNSYPKELHGTPKGKVSGGSSILIQIHLSLKRRSRYRDIGF